MISLLFSKNKTNQIQKRKQNKTKQNKIKNERKPACSYDDKRKTFFGSILYAY